MIYNLSHTHSKGKFGGKKTMDKNPDGIVSKEFASYMLSIKQGSYTFRIESGLDIWAVNYVLANKSIYGPSYHADTDYCYNPVGTVLTFTQE